MKAFFTLTTLLLLGSAAFAETGIPAPELYQKVAVPETLLQERTVEGNTLRFGGDVRIGDLDGDDLVDFLVYRSVDDAHDGGGMKPCFMAAFTLDGDVLWQTGEDGDQPSRPGPVVVYDVDGDGADEVVCFFLNPAVDAHPHSLANVVLQVRDGKTGDVLREAAPEALTARRGHGPNWVHQRILVANFRGTARPRDFVVKLGDTLLAFSDELDVLWTYQTQWKTYGNCPAYIPAVGDMNGDGRDEVNGGYFVLGPDGEPHWEKKLGNHMDSVAVTAWDDGHVRAICSGFGHVMDIAGNAVLRLGPETVPHGQEVRVAPFRARDDAPLMVLRYDAHTPPVIVVDTAGKIINHFDLNDSPNGTGMETVFWRSPDHGAVLYHGRMLWDVVAGAGMALPDLPDPAGPHRQGWYHCIPADVCGDAREEAVLYNPWDDAVYIFTPSPLDAAAHDGYTPGPRQYNPRIMD